MAMFGDYMKNDPHLGAQVWFTVLDGPRFTCFVTGTPPCGAVADSLGWNCATSPCMTLPPISCGDQLARLEILSMFNISDSLIYKIGQIAVAAGDLESCLAVFAAHEMNLNVLDILAQPGGALRSSRKAANLMDELSRDLFHQAIDQIADLLRERNSIIHSMWINEGSREDAVHIAMHPRTKVRIPEADFSIDELLVQMFSARQRLISLLTDRINNRPLV